MIRDAVGAQLLSGDATFDGTVNTTDFNVLAANFGQAGRKWSQADFDFNGQVDTTDFNFLAANFGQTAPNSSAARALGAAVPEPSTLGGFAIAGLVMLGKKRRRNTIASRA